MWRKLCWQQNIRTTCFSLIHVAQIAVIWKRLHKTDAIWQQRCYYFCPSLCPIPREWNRIWKRTAVPFYLDENLIHGSVVASITKEYSLLDQFNTLVRRCVEGGILLRYLAQLKLEALLRSRTKSDEDGSSTYFVFTVSHMGPAFSVLGFGYVCSIIVCIAECWHKHFSKLWQAKRRTHLPWSTRWIRTVLTAQTRPHFHRSCYMYCMCVRAITIVDAR
jgi:hypothetical protein